MDGTRITTHDNIKRALQFCMEYAGWITQLEPKNYFAESGKRPDIRANRPGNIAEATMLFDVMITCPLPTEGTVAGNLSFNEAITPQRAAQKAWTSKMSKYANETTNVQAEFHPFIMETTGLIHLHGLQLLTELAETASQIRGIKVHIIKNYFIKVLSCALQKSIADAIILRNAACSSALGMQAHNELLEDIFDDSYNTF